MRSASIQVTTSCQLRRVACSTWTESKRLPSARSRSTANQVELDA
jgi:hypothetical protein